MNLRYNSMFNGDNEPRRPLVAVALCFVLGVIVAWRWLFEPLSLVALLLFIVGFCALFGARCVGRFRGLWSLLVVVGVVLSGMVAMTYSRDSSSGVVDEGIYALRVVSERSVRVEAVRGEDSRWRGCEEELIFGCDSTFEFSRGDRVVVEGRVRRFGGVGRGYIYISKRSVLDYEEGALLGARINRFLSGRVDQLSLNGESSSLVKAMLLGNRRGLSVDTTRSYRRSGAAHLLAVSGLHVAIVAAIFTLLLTPLLFLFRGHVWRSILVVLSIWIYAYVVGMSTSITRSAIMYTGLVIAPILGRDYNSLNILSFAVLAMTLLDPFVIFDVGFQLSVVSVASIIVWAIPLWRVVRRRSRSLALVQKLVLLPLIIGLCCSVATLPIVSYTFGYFSIFGVLLNPLLLITIYLILALSLVWVIVGFALLAPLFRFAIELCVSLQSGVVEWASVGWRDAVEFRIGGVSVVLIYLLYLLLTILIKDYLSHRRAYISIK